MYMYPRCIIFICTLLIQSKKKLHIVNRLNLSFNTSTQIHVQIKQKKFSDKTCRAVHAYCSIPDYQTCNTLTHLITSTLFMVTNTIKQFPDNVHCYRVNSLERHLDILRLGIQTERETGCQLSKQTIDIPTYYLQTQGTSCRARAKWNKGGKKSCIYLSSEIDKHQK